MLRSTYAAVRQVRAVNASRWLSSGQKKGGSNEHIPITRHSDAVQLDVQDIIAPSHPVTPVQVTTDEVADIGGVPLEHQTGRRARIFQPPRGTTQAGWNNAQGWKIQLDTRERWDNPLIGYCSSGDPLSNIDMALHFATREDAIAFCEKNRWQWEIEEPNERQIKPKNYGSNFSWSKRSRVSTK
ncbi:hypothetical protein WR25_11279 [Diploscapter pachys]|uniref:NADH dehydrogenase [ubiquinone] iron-sulfur protein 4, mitochondrial n=1 Tax=Diploscapter pachys TaxID=2018661 RepID=A0A2A2KAW6_9BILA|nr:hypothetical protein WR25_11279 [Diploscapter pachys]